LAAATRDGWGQEDAWTLGFAGPETLSGRSGETQSGAYTTTLKHAGPGPNAQAWSYGVVAEDCIITEVALPGTLAEIAHAGGFNLTELVSQEKNPGVTSGMVSAVVLDLKKGTTLSANRTWAIAHMNVSAVIPAGDGAARLLYRDGLIGSGEPMPIVVTQAGESRTAALTAKDIQLHEVVSCCGALANFGFSGTRVSGDSSGIIDADPSRCFASGGDLVVASPRGERGIARVYSNLSFDAAAGGLQGWSHGITLDGEGDFVPGSATLTGTFAERAYIGGFDATEIVNPAKQFPRGQKGLVSAVVFKLGRGIAAPLLRAESILTFEVAAATRQNVHVQTVTLRYRAGLVGSGEPVPHTVVLGDDPLEACNFDLADLRIRFVMATAPEFSRGDANGQRGLDIADPIWILNDLFGDGPASPCPAAEDVNDDGLIDASDVTYLIDYLFRGTASPAPPFGACGPDPTPGATALPCETGC
jgi:hypothetical protein